MLAFCATALTGYILGSIFVTRGASLAARPERVPVVGLARAAHAADLDPHVHRDAARGAGRTIPAERQRCLTIVHQELARLDGLVGKLIELSKIESRHTAFERRAGRRSPTSSNDALAAFEAVRFGGRRSTLKVEVEPELIVLGDRAALAQALGNLLSNAWKYTRRAASRSTSSATADAEHVIIAVSDNGVGSRARSRRPIFEKFQRGRRRSTAAAPGIGLGLAIVRAIVEAHRGRGRRPRRAPTRGAGSASCCPALRAEAA